MVVVAFVATAVIFATVVGVAVAMAVVALVGTAQPHPARPCPFVTRTRSRGNGQGQSAGASHACAYSVHSLVCVVVGGAVVAGGAVVGGLVGGFGHRPHFLGHPLLSSAAVKPGQSAPHVGLLQYAAFGMIAHSGRVSLHVEGAAVVAAAVVAAAVVAVVALVGAAQPHPSRPCPFVTRTRSWKNGQGQSAGASHACAYSVHSLVCVVVGGAVVAGGAVVGGLVGGFGHRPHFLGHPLLSSAAVKPGQSAPHVGLLQYAAFGMNAHSGRVSLHVEGAAVVAAAVVVAGALGFILHGGAADAHGWVLADARSTSAQQPFDASHPDAFAPQEAQAAGQQAPLVGCGVPILHVGSTPVRACVVRKDQPASTADSFHCWVDSGYAWPMPSNVHHRAVVVPLVSTHLKKARGKIVK